MTTLARPICPRQPDTMRQLIQEYDATLQSVTRAQLNLALTYNERERVIGRLEKDLVALGELVREWDASPEGKAWYAAVTTYNAQVDAYNAQIKAERQARVNARETAKVRSQTCSRCFASHPGEC